MSNRRVRTSFDNKHSHELQLPPDPPEVRSVFFTEPPGEEGDWHTHSFFWGGPGEQFGVKAVEEAGSDESFVLDPEQDPTRRGPEGQFAVRGQVEDGDPDGSFPHTHIIEILL